jgi:hypothetical protein
MKNRLKFISGGLLALLVATAVSAQQSVIKVDITGIGVGLGSTPIAPVNERSGPAGTPITIQATAVGTFLKDSFTYFYYVNGQTIGKTDEPVAPPDSAINIWAPPQPGVYDISVTATDGANSATSLPVRYYATGTVVNSPLDGTLVPQGSTVVLKADATVSGGFIREIQFFDNGVPIGKPDTTLPYSLIYTPSGAAGTIHNITAQATDNDGTPVSASAPISIRVVNPTSSLPTCAITTPQKGASIPIPTEATSDISIKVDANSPNDRISKVELYIDGELFGSSTKYPYAFAWHPTVTGSYDLVALAYDGKGNVVASTAGATTSSVPSPITVIVAAPPTPTLLSPTSSAVVPGDTAAFATVTASSSNGYPVTIQLFVDGVIAGSTTIRSANAVDTITYVPVQKTTVDEAGNITPIPSVIYLFASDPLGFTGKSPEISINVTKGGNNTPPGDTNGSGGDGTTTTPKDVPNPVYSGSFIGAGESGQFTVTKISDQTVTFMGSSTSAGVTKTYFFNDVAVDASGGFRVVDDQGRVLLQGNLSDINAIGTLNGGAATFIGAIDLTASGNKVAAGYYTGSLAGRSASALNAIVGANGSLSLNIQDGTFSDQISTTLDAAGAFSVTTSAGNSISGKVDPATGFLTGSIAGKTSGTFTGARASGGTASDGFLRNISTRGSVGAGDKILIAGFVVDGTAPKQLLIRAAGPALASDLPGASLADPRLHVLKLSGSSWTTVGTNDDWDAADAPTMTAVGASTFTVGSKDAALVDTFAPGIYTAQVSSADATGGIALVEIYDVDTLTPYSTQKMINISTRGDVGTGDKILIAGFVVNGTAPKKVLVRGLGPTLAADPIKLAGAIADPALQILRMGSGSSTLVRENDNWQAGNDATLMRAAAAKVGATALVEGGKDAAILITLPPGIYTAQMSGTGASTGIGLIEVYEVP